MLEELEWLSSDEDEAPLPMTPYEAVMLQSVSYNPDLDLEEVEAPPTEGGDQERWAEIEQSISLDESEQSEPIEQSEM